MSRQHLTLSKSAYRNALSQYVAFFVVMNPLDFLRLTTMTDKGIEEISKNEFATSPESYKSGKDRRFQPSQYNMPFLYVSESGKISGHEGRHRAAMVMKSGGRAFPVAIYIKQDYKYYVEWKEYRYDELNDESLDDEHFSREFSEYREAEKFLKEMENKARHPDNYTIARYSVKLITHGGSSLRGHPERSESYDYANWRDDEFPKILIGQFNQEIRIPSSAMRITAIKHPVRKK